MSPPDSELIARSLASDDRAAFGELVRRHQSSVRRFLRSLSGDATLADDLAQDTFVQAWRSLRRFDGQSQFSTWLLGIAHNHWRNARRSRLRAPFNNDSGHGTTEPSEPSQERSSDLRRDLGEALRHLSPDEQTAIHLCYHQGLSHSEAASVVGWPVGTLKTHLSRSKDRLRDILSSWNPRT